jgi:iron(III) transport system ATP-binding protein
LSNLDAKLRVEMRETIRDIQHEAGITTVYVTHDQEEAMSISDRIAVMNEGVVQQVGAPQEIYHRPANLFVAGFIGKTNTVVRPVERVGGKIRVVLDAQNTLDITAAVDSDKVGEKLTVSVRPEAVVAAPDGPGLPATIIDHTFLGPQNQVRAKLADDTMLEFLEFSGVSHAWKPGQPVRLTFDAERLNYFDETGGSVMAGAKP